MATQTMAMTLARRAPADAIALAKAPSSRSRVHLAPILDRARRAEVSRAPWGSTLVPVLYTVLHSPPPRTPLSIEQGTRFPEDLPPFWLHPAHVALLGLRFALCDAEQRTISDPVLAEAVSLREDRISTPNLFAVLSKLPQVREVSALSLQDTALREVSR